YWCTADIGWVTGHSYVVYGPLSNGATALMYEGAPNWPEPDRFWDIIGRHRVNILYTAPTAIRAFIKWGEQWPLKHDLSSLRLLGTGGERINLEAGMWYHRVIGKRRCPIMLRKIYSDDERYRQQYWSQIDGVYFAGDGARRDQDGYFWIMGRIDDVINVAGHRLGTAEIESALVSHEAVAESAVVARPDDLKGSAIVAFVTLEGGRTPTDPLKEELRQHVAHEIGALAKPDDIRFADALPKTRSGKIMRRLLREFATSGSVSGD